MVNHGLDGEHIMTLYHALETLSRHNFAQFAKK
jgi:hypothetical protein